MTEDLIFNSFDKPIPPVRQDLQFIPVEHNGRSLLYIYDVLGYVPPDLALNPEVESLFTFFNGSFSILNISELARNGVDRDDLLDFVKFLDKNCLLRSGYFRQETSSIEKKFERASGRPAALAGSSYPENPADLQSWLDRIFSAAGEDQGFSPEKALYAPHIDPQIGGSIYARAFSVLKKIKPRRVVILATAHYAGHYSGIYDQSPFIGTQKIFELPNGSLSADNSYIEKLSETREATGFTLQDRAHRVEHSIELHLLFAQYIWKHPFTIVPVLVNSFEDMFYMSDGHLCRQIDHFSETLRELDDDETFYLISGDLSHIGKKFGDEIPATSMKKSVKTFDERFMDHAAANRRPDLLEQISADHDSYRVCGFPPLYTFLNTFPSLTGECIDYHWWDETERESAVSFGAISY